MDCGQSIPNNILTGNKEFVFNLAPVAKKTSVNFVCDNGKTEPGWSVYVSGSLSELGSWNPAQAVKLDPSIYWEYIVTPPPSGGRYGPTEPIWTGVVSNLPSQPDFEWKCLIRREDGTGDVHWQHENNNHFTSTITSGYAGRGKGRM
ncbi:MAG: hypothetical protein H7829_09380 [Magnetococcus sp. THC-1_WYH]